MRLSSLASFYTAFHQPFYDYWPKDAALALFSVLLGITYVVFMLLSADHLLRVDQFYCQITATSAIELGKGYIINEQRSQTDRTYVMSLLWATPP